MIANLLIIDITINFLIYLLLIIVLIKVVKSMSKLNELEIVIADLSNTIQNAITIINNASIPDSVIQPMIDSLNASNKALDEAIHPTLPQPEPIPITEGI